MTKVTSITKPIKDGTMQRWIENLNFDSTMQFDSAWWIVFSHHYSTFIVCGANWKYQSDFRGMRIPIFAVFRLLLHHFLMCLHRILYRIKIKQHWLCSQWSTKLETEIGLSDGCKLFHFRIDTSVLEQLHQLYALQSCTKFCTGIINVVSSISRIRHYR